MKTYEKHINMFACGNQLAATYFLGLIKQFLPCNCTVWYNLCVNLNIHFAK